MSSETLDILENGSLEDIDLLIFEIKEAINSRQDCADVINLMEENGIILAFDSGGDIRICKKKRPG